VRGCHPRMGSPIIERRPDNLWQGLRTMTVPSNLAEYLTV
jgi:hypothetical protein